ncbi:oocyte zinc finger protein XlCOF6-like isoform X3 [Biomphalaria glabrata]|nr:oocyte zinc finger protein XlCOF6-like isoform X3 [Biomphalaria glabrata]
MALPGDNGNIFSQERYLEYVDNLPEYGGLNIVPDAVVPSDSRKGEDEDYSKKTLPEGLVIKSSEIPEAGLGVFATKLFPSRTRFGPYLGKIEKNKIKAEKTGFSWQIYKNGKASHFVNADDPSNSNWMRFVNCSRSEGEQSVQAYQHRGQIYFIAPKAIQPNTEILVYYGDKYAKLLGIPLQKSEQSKKKQADNQKGNLHCNFCPLVFVSFHFYIESHLKHQHPEHYWNLINMCQRKDTTQTDSETCEISKQPNKSCACYLNRRSKAKRFTCNICAKTFASRNSIKIHVFTHTGEKPFQCDVCNRKFTLSHFLTRHKLVHSSEKPFVCNICGESFKQPSSLGSHKSRKHNDLRQSFKDAGQRKQYACSFCRKMFSRPYCVKKHELIHTRKQFPCDKCDQNQQNKSCTCYLNLHTNSKFKEKKFACNLCAKKFTFLRSLKSHVFTHTGERQFHCDVCGGQFSQLYILKSHKLIHSSGKKFICDICGECFKHQNSCLSHKCRKHSDSIYTSSKQKLLTENGKSHLPLCDVCGQSFASSFSLKRHQLLHTRQQLMCDKCDQLFETAGILKRHKC